MDIVESQTTGAEKNPSLGQQTQEIRQSLRKIERHDWALWICALVVILSLTGAIITFSVAVLSKPEEPFFQIHMSQSVRGLVGLVLLYSVYTIFQQVKLRQLRVQLERQIEVAAEQQMRAEEFMKLAILDPLTNLHNRRFAEKQLLAEMARSRRSGHALTIVLLDLDNFKEINDRYGHGAGDTVLKTFAESLNRAIRASDLAARIGGDEFMIQLPECPEGHVERVLNRLKSVEVGVEGAKILVSFSAGWGAYQPSDTMESFLHRADTALYEDKKNRRPAVRQ